MYKQENITKIWKVLKRSQITVKFLITLDLIFKNYYSNKLLNINNK